MIARVRHWIAAVVDFFREWFERFLDLTGFDRAMALAGSAFSALIPLMIVYGALVSKATGADFSDRMIDAFELTGGAADAMKTAFAPPKEVEDATNLAGALLLVLSALSFTRAMQRMYQIAFDQPSLGWRAARWGLSWLGLVVVIMTLRPIVLGGVHGGLDAVLSVGFGFLLWLMTPFVLLAYRVPWRSLVPAGLLTAIAMSSYTASAAVWMPRTVSNSAEQFGAFGIAFAMLGWLVGAGVVLVVCSAGGALIADRLRLPLQDESAGTGSSDVPAKRARSADA